MKNRDRTEIELLETRINDAADGLLNQQEIADLEKALQDHPDLLHDYKEIMSLPDFSVAYGGLQENPHAESVSTILKKIERIEGQKSVTNFDNITILWFKKYAIAASFMILAVTSVFNLSQSQIADGEVAIDELFYPEADLGSDEYVTYLNEWIEQ